MSWNPQPCPLRLPEVAFSAVQNIAMEIVYSGSPTEILFEFTGIIVEKSQKIHGVLASAMQTTPGALRKTLQRRKEDELLRILPRGEKSKDLEDSIESLADLL
jgi:hypothetical protein